MYKHICKSTSKLKSYLRTFVFFLYVRYYMSGLSSPSHCVAMATIHFSTTVASFYFGGLIMTKYQKDSCILDVLPSMVNKGSLVFGTPVQVACAEVGVVMHTFKSLGAPTGTFSPE